MPSTTSSWVSIVFDSSTVITPSLPTFFMASAMILPMVSSLLAEMVPTCAIISPETGFESWVRAPPLRLPSSSVVPTTATTAFSMPRFRAIGFAPAATVFTPSRKIDCARTVAVVVPSPATSEVLEATSRTICAPMFSSASWSSISLATVTPSLVMVGDPNFFSMTTLRPLGPSVTLTASASLLTPWRMRCRASSPYEIVFAAICDYSFVDFRLLLDHGKHLVLAEDQVLLVADLDLGSGVVADEGAVPLLDVQGEPLASVVDLPHADGDDLHLPRLLLGGVGD